MLHGYRGYKMAIYENLNSDKASLGLAMFNVLPDIFGGTSNDYIVWYQGENPNYLYIKTELATLEQLTDFVDNFQHPTDPVLIQTQLANAKRGLFIDRKFKTILDKREIPTWL